MYRVIDPKPAPGAPWASPGGVNVRKAYVPAASLSIRTDPVYWSPTAPENHHQLRHPHRPGLAAVHRQRGRLLPEVRAGREPGLRHSSRCRRHGDQRRSRDDSLHAGAIHDGRFEGWIADRPGESVQEEPLRPYGDE